MASLLGYVAGGALSGIGGGIREQAKQTALREGEEAKQRFMLMQAELAHKRQLVRDRQQREFMTSEREAEQTYKTGERKGGEEAAAGLLGRRMEHETGLQKMDQFFEAHQGELTRDHAKQMQTMRAESEALQGALNRAEQRAQGTAGRKHTEKIARMRIEATSLEAELGRAHAALQGELNREARADLSAEVNSLQERLAKLRIEATSTENALDRELTAGEGAANRGLRAAEGEADRGLRRETREDEQAHDVLMLELEQLGQGEGFDLDDQLKMEKRMRDRVQKDFPAVAKDPLTGLPTVIMIQDPVKLRNATVIWAKLGNKMPSQLPKAQRKLTPEEVIEFIYGLREDYAAYAQRKSGEVEESFPRWNPKEDSFYLEAIRELGFTFDAPAVRGALSRERQRLGGGP